MGEPSPFRSGPVYITTPDANDPPCACGARPAVRRIFFGWPGTRDPAVPLCLDCLRILSEQTAEFGKEDCVWQEPLAGSRMSRVKKEN